jgi:peptidoglycan/LPS O-acetylase OafA/YrhL
MTAEDEKRGYVVAQVVMVVLFLVTAFVIAVFVPGDAKTKLTMSIGYGLLVLTFLFGMVILVDIIRGNIDLKTLLSEDGKGASMSRFQLLIFTFVIALSLFLLVVENGKEFPKIPADILTLLGISASTYAVSKGIQAGSNGKTPPSGGGGGGNG